MALAAANSPSHQRHDAIRRLCWPLGQMLEPGSDSRRLSAKSVGQGAYVMAGLVTCEQCRVGFSCPRRIGAGVLPTYFGDVCGRATGGELRPVCAAERSGEAIDRCG